MRRLTPNGGTASSVPNDCPMWPARCDELFFQCDRTAAELVDLIVVNRFRHQAQPNGA
jgi:hypothetical protein